MSDTSIVLSISMLISGREEMAKSLNSLLYFKNAIPCEIILTDTGCNSEQRALAEQYADKIINFQWCNDFAAARNVGLKEAQGEWFLYLDDDEWFENPQEIVDFFRTGEYKQYNCASYVQRNYSNLRGTMYDDAYVSRMIKLEANTKFVGKIHEFLTPFSLPKKNFLDFVHHYGYVYKDAEDKMKHARRNIVPLLEMRKEYPGDPRWMCQLAQEYFAIAEYEKNVEMCKEALEEWKALKQYVEYAPSHIGAVYAYILISLETIGTKEALEEGVEWLPRALEEPVLKMREMEPTIAFFYLVGARLYSKLKKYELCREYFRKYLNYYRRLKDDRELVEIGAATITSGVFQEQILYGGILLGMESFIRTEDYALAEEAFYLMDWSDRRLLHQLEHERAIVDACCSVKYHPTWVKILQTLVAREDGMKEMYVVFLEAEINYKQNGEKEKLSALRKLVSQLDYEHRYILCTKILWAEEDPTLKSEEERKEKEEVLFGQLFEKYEDQLSEIKEEIWRVAERKGIITRHSEEKNVEEKSLDIELAYNILDILQTMRDAVKQMQLAYAEGNIEGFNALSMDLWDGLTAVKELAEQEIPKGSRNRLADACVCALESLKDIKLLVITAPEKVEWKLEYELDAIIETMATQFYYWGIVDKHPEKREEFQEFLENTDAFGLLQIPEEEREYLYDLVIVVTAYNHLDVTKMCVKSILENLPLGIRTELVLFNHGSSDGTKEYFESIAGARVINVAVNGAMPYVVLKTMCRGIFHLSVSNDVVIGKNAIQNLMQCAIEHPDYGYIVPATSNISNYQNLDVDYNSQEDFMHFAECNNHYDEKRHEQRIRLCNPLHLMRTDIAVKMCLDSYEEKACSRSSFYTDDKTSVWMRRNGYKNILAKDAYCHHVGEVTVKEEFSRKEQEERYLEGRKYFVQRYGVDPWGPGFCYEPELFEKWDFPIIDNAQILGINCGLGSNSLKVKEILKEKGAKNAYLVNCEQDAKYIQDLQGVSDEAYVFGNLQDIVEKSKRNRYDYIVIEGSITGCERNSIISALTNAGLKYSQLVVRMAEQEWVIYEGERSGE